MVDRARFFELDRSAVRVVRKTDMGSDAAFWVNQPPELRLATLELLRKEFHDGDQQGLQRVLTVAQRS